ncbi:MAG: RHS repeat protein, partial [Chloroflexi bacterium]|nr:RHS repeat protein [Chloroflexota bacterium]
MNDKATSIEMNSLRTRVSSIIFGILPSLLLLYGLFAFFNTDQLTLAATNYKEISADVEINVQDDVEVNETDIPIVASDQLHPVKTNAALPLLDVSQFTNVSNNANESINPCIALNSSDTPYFVWEEGGEIYFKQLNGTSANVSNSPSVDSSNPAIAVDDSNDIYIVWREVTGSNDAEIFYSKSTNGGQSWGAPFNVSAPFIDAEWGYDYGAYTPQISISSDGFVHIVWTHSIEGEAFQPPILLHRYLNGSTWSNISTVVNSMGLDPVSSDLYDVSPGDNGEIHVIWIDWQGQNSTNDDVIAYRVWNGSSWGSRVDLIITISNGSPTISMDSLGTIHVAWIQSGWINYQNKPSGSSVWSTTETVSQVGGGSNDGSPEITASGDGDVYLAWLSDQALVYTHKDSGGWTVAETVVPLEDSPAKHKTCQLTQDSSQNAHFTFDAQNGAQRDVFYTPLIASAGPPIAFGQDWNVECPFCSVANTQGVVHGLNTRTGNYGFQETDIALPIAGGNLNFSRSYASESRDTYTTTMGYGWVHNYDMQLQFDNTALTHTVVLQAPGGSRFPYYGNGDGTYTKYAGVTAALVRVDGANPEDTVYTITAFDQTQAVFDADGKLTERIDPYGNSVTLTYADFNGTQRLFRATQGSRFLEYDYDNNGRLVEVMDSSSNSRTVALEYDSNDDLVMVTSTLGLTTTYEYSGMTHLLTRIIDPSGKSVRQITYDDNGRATIVRDGIGAAIADTTFSNSTVRVNGVPLTHTYSSRGTLEGITFSCADGSTGCDTSSGTGYDYNFNANQTADANNNAPSTYIWNSSGSSLSYMQDALNNETFLGYDQFNNLTQTVNARGITTTYQYDNASFPTFLTQIIDGLDNSTLYTPTTVADGIPGLLKQQEDPDGKIITYAYNDFGQITETVRAAGTSEAITTTYGYDTVGRLTTNTQTSITESHTSLNVYDDGNRLIATIANWDGLLDWQNCSFASGSRDENICTLYDYDNAGRTISMTNGLGQTNLTFYDGAGAVYLTVTNWDGAAYNEANPFPNLCDYANPDPEFNLCSQTVYDEDGRPYAFFDSLGRETVTEFDGLGRVSRTVSNWQDGIFNANDLDADIETLYEYDANGNTLIVTDTVGRMSRTFYDALNRAEGTISNWDGTTTLAGCSSLPTMRDSNICSQYQYDKVGNTIIVTDTLGRMTRTFYDELNRVEATVANWQPSFTSPANCVLSATNEAVENVCTVYGYDDVGNQITTTNALNQTSLTVYDAANRPFLTVRNWDGTSISSENDCSFPPAQSDTNVCSVTYYDTLGRRSSGKDGMGSLTDYEYDGLGRLITTTRYLDQLPIYTITQYDALGNRLTQTDAEGNDTSFVYDSLNRLALTTSAEGVTRTQLYNAAGWVLQSLDGLGHATTFGYDDLGRRLTVTDAESNTITSEYDALGNQTAMIDAEMVRTSYQYDDLNRLLQVIENDVAGSNATNENDVVTEYSYDALGNRINITNALGVTNTYTIYDVLNRPVIVEDALGNQTTTQYNALGYRTVMTDSNEAVTTYAYDGLNRLSSVNYLADNETVQYSYDGLGNRTVMTDSLGITSYSYDDLYRLTGVNDPFTASVGYGYDKVGNRTRLTYPDSRVVTYTYDLDNRLETVLDWD